MKTRTQLLLWLLAALLSMVLVIAGVQGAVIYQQTRDTTLNLLEHQAAALAMQTQIWFERIAQAEQFLARQMANKAGRGAEAEKVLAGFYHAEEGVDSLVVADDRGRILNLYPANAMLERKGVASEPYFLDTLIKQTMRTSGVIASPLTGKPSVAITRPVLLAEGPAVIIVYLNLDFLTDMTRAYWVGQSGRSLIFNGQGQTISAGSLAVNVPEELLRRFLLDQRGGAIGASDFYAVARATGPEWGTAVVLPQQEVLQRILQGGPYLAGVFLLVFLLLAAGANWLVNRGVKPLQALTAQAKHMADGNFAAALDVNRYALHGATREIVDLANVFNRMADELQRHIAALQKANQALEKKEERWRLALAGSSVGVWDWDLLTREIFFSPQAKKLFGYADDEIDNTVEDWREKAHPDDREWIKAAMNAHLNGETEIYQVEYRFRDKQGEYRWAMARGRMLKAADGTPIRLAGSISDVTERHQYEAALQRANEKLEEKVEERTQELLAMNEELQAINTELQNMNAQLEQEIEVRRQVESQLEETNGELSQTLESLRQTQEELVQKEKIASLAGLVAGVAHEVNTPIGVAVTASSYLEQVLQQLTVQYREKQLTAGLMETHLEDAGEAMAILSVNLQKAAMLIRNFKQVAADQSNDSRRIFFLREYLQEVVLSVQAPLKKMPCSIQLEVDDAIKIFSYPGAVAKVLSNLIHNSLQHAYQPGDKGTITIAARQEGEMVILAYRDDGRGMPDEMRRRIFEPFFTTQRGRGGLGLGLYIVYNTVREVLGGTVECISQPEQGTTFIIRLPVGEATAE